MSGVLLVLIVTSLACGVLGPFIILRNLSMMADALSHSVLLGIVVAFIFVGSLDSIWLSIGAALFGILTVYIVELLSKKKLVKHDDALGIVFPMFFSLAVVIITKMFRNAHLDVDIVLMGNPLFAPFIKLFNLPRSLVIMGFLFVVNLLFVIVFYKKLKVSTFDKEYAGLSGLNLNIIFYALMTLTSITCVCAFDSVGAILVISLFVTPTATAYLVSKDLKVMILLTLIIGIFNSIMGYYLGIYFNVSISGMCSFISMLVCILFIFINKKGIIYKFINKMKNKEKLMHDLIMIHVYRHRDSQDELGFNSIHEHLNWKKRLSDKYLLDLIRDNLIERNENLHIYQLSSKGILYVKMLLG